MGWMRRDLWVVHFWKLGLIERGPENGVRGMNHRGSECIVDSMRAQNSTHGLRKTTTIHSLELFSYNSLYGLSVGRGRDRYCIILLAFVDHLELVLLAMLSWPSSMILLAALREGTWAYA